MPCSFPWDGVWPSLFGWLYFDHVNSSPLKRMKPFFQLIWMYFHLPLVLGLILMGGSLKTVLSGIEADELLASARISICMSVAFALFALGILNLITRFQTWRDYWSIEVANVHRPSVRDRYRTMLLFISAAIVAALGRASQLDVVGMVVVIWCILVFQVLASIATNVGKRVEKLEKLENPEENQDIELATHKH